MYFNLVNPFKEKFSCSYFKGANKSPQQNGSRYSRVGQVKLVEDNL